MSLTSELKDPTSPIRQFLYGEFPNARALVGDARDTLASAMTIKPSGIVAWGTVGTAIDYRLRYYFRVTPSDEFGAYQGAAQVDPDTIGGMYPAGSRPLLPPGLADAFFAELDRHVAAVELVDRRLDGPQEASLNRYCYALALFEELFRAGTGIRSPLFFPAPVGDVGTLLAIPSQVAIDDLCCLSWAFFDGYAATISGAGEIALDPTFDGSKDVGGADADIILDGCLWEIKTSIKPNLDPFALYRLLGYTLLDYSDRHKIGSVAVYMARQQVLLKWPLTEFLAAMAGGSATELAGVRRRFQQVGQGVKASRYAGQTQLRLVKLPAAQ